jgi:hypothetical protein
MGNGGQACGQAPSSRHQVFSLVYRDGKHLPSKPYFRSRHVHILVYL